LRNSSLQIFPQLVFGQNYFDHWIIFDDLWASAHADLANSLIRQLDRWDVLSSPRRSRSD
jgi:hypothetical protein